MRTLLKTSLVLMTIMVTACGGEGLSPNNQGSMTSSGMSTSTGSGGGGDSQSGGGGDCQTLAPPPGEELPHVSVTGTTATAITQALDAIFASQTPPISPGQTYSIPTLDCRSAENPSGTSVLCTMEVAIGGGEPIPVRMSEASSALALDLLEAFLAADLACADAHGLNIHIKNMSVSPEAVEYDDRTKLDVFPPPNVVVRGMAAQNVVDAVAAAGINECGSDDGKVRFVCDTLGDGLSCSFIWWPTEKVGSSELIQVCGAMGPSLDPNDLLPVPAAASPALWQSILAAAEEAGYQPLNGTLAEATVLNADFFRWNGSSLGFRVIVDNIQGSPQPPEE
jgi:hypothetical protein